MLRWGFIGAGYVASRALTPAVHRSATAHLQAVASRNPSQAAALNPTTTYSDYNALLADPNVDAVYISLPNHLHAQWSIAALEAGKYVLCEKPFAMNPHEATAMAQAAADNKRLLMEAIWFKWHPRTKRLQELVANGDIGALATIDSTFTFPINAPGNYRLDPSMGGGALFDLGPYQLHLWQLLLSSSADVKYIKVNQELVGSTVDMTTSFSAFINGSVAAEALVSFNQPESQIISIGGTQATISFNTGEAFTSHNAPSSLTIADRQEDFAPVDPYQLMIEDFFAITQGATNATAPLDATLFVAKQLEQIRSSAQ